MTDIKLFRFGSEEIATELEPTAAPLERTLQRLFEANLETLLGIRFLATEHSTGAVHAGRIDTLGIDENNAPVIIEYKRATNENVINQGLFYLDWLVDHRREFEWLVLEKLGRDIAGAVDWTATRLLCIAGDFTRFDTHAVKQIRRNIELLRYRRFQDDLLAIELIHAPLPAKAPAARSEPMISAELVEEKVMGPDLRAPEEQIAYRTQTFEYRLETASGAIRDLYDASSEALISLGDDIQTKAQKYYRAFRRIKNFACVQVGTGDLTVWLKLDPDTVDLEAGFTRDMRNTGHHGTGDLEVRLRSRDDLEKALPLFRRSYDRS